MFAPKYSSHHNLNAKVILLRSVAPCTINGERYVPLEDDSEHVN